ncbi:MAG: biopolymer transporter ExbD [Terracidiphilus sp.]
MSMTTGGGGGYSSDINVTPMIDILLVLLIIFMVIVPVTPKGLDALVPQPPKNPQKDTTTDRTIVVQVLYRQGASPLYKINETDVTKAELLPRLTDIYANRAERVMFVKGDDKIDFRYVAEAIDIGRSAGVDHIGLMTPKILAGQ